MQNNHLSWEEALLYLKSESERTFNETRPVAVVISCSEAAFIPEQLFGLQAGQLYNVRIAGGVVDAAVIASVEHAIQYYGIKLILIIGHSDCSFIEKAIENKDQGFYQNQLFAHFKPAIEIAKEKSLATIAAIHTNLSVVALQDRSPIIEQACASQGVKIVPMFFHADSGKAVFL